MNKQNNEFSIPVADIIIDSFLTLASLFLVWRGYSNYIIYHDFYSNIIVNFGIAAFLMLFVFFSITDILAENDSSFLNKPIRKTKKK